MAASVRYVRKQIVRAIEDAGAVDQNQNEIYIVANPGEALTEFAYPGVRLPRPRRDYDALEFTVNKRYGDNWLLYASYVWSRLYGNYPGLSQSDENGRVSPNVGRLYDLVEMMFDETGRPVFGPLPTDRPHRLKAHGVYTLPFGTTVGATYYLASGVPVTRELGFLPPNNFPVQYRGRMSDGRTDTMSQTDVYLQHEFRLPGGKQLQVNVTVQNLFDQDAAMDKWSTYQLVDGIRFQKADFFGGRLDFDRLIEAQRIKQDPRFLQDSLFQAPISTLLA